VPQKKAHAKGEKTFMPATAIPGAPPSARKPFYRILYVQVLFAIALGGALGYFEPKLAIQMKPLGDGFIKLIRMVIGFVVFFTIVSGIAGMENLKKVGRVGIKALIYFEVVSTLALIIGMIVGNYVRPGDGFNADVSKLDVNAVAAYAGKAKEQTIVEFLLNIIPNTIVDAFAKGDILPVILVALVFGYALSRLGERCRPVRDVIHAGEHLVFEVIRLLMKFAPIGAFGAMAFTIGRFGLSAIGPLVTLIATFWLTSAIFVIGVLGLISAIAGFNVFKFLAYIKEEILIVLGTSSSDPALPPLMAKLEHLGCSKPVTGLVVPTGYVFNTDGSAIYMTMAALFVAQATNIELTLTQQLALFLVAMLTSKGASGVTGASFIALVATLAVVPTIPVAGMALILGIDRFMSEARALVNMVGNGIATVVLAKWEGELDEERMRAVLNGRLPAPAENPALGAAAAAEPAEA
jgi:aerobic C4-dicarboxylate transport protein